MSDDFYEYWIDSKFLFEDNLWMVKSLNPLKDDDF